MSILSIIFTIIFAVLFVGGVYLLTGEPLSALGAFIALIIGVIIYIFQVNQSFIGQIVDIKEKTTHHSDDDGSDYTTRTTFAYLKLRNGKTKKIHYQNGWQIGDVIEKRKGDAMPRRIS
ncbi:hypothetical protein Mevan_0210 [Methanococcus vannielii SB]|uniref:Uncharacterized protein n=1 Tax=Methanococcus vannielii (strain ATCC 35089 / DSM 1224 / JCM 13029 / OCM 148 / SB) TaxID=406327 RepID=A6UNP8_METVS|nr:hypothetical protein [Methanococcus vannielii]ABR54120.1 hypothetical protein Mevan_0210 [Methanococcus vannielii SB]